MVPEVVTLAPGFVVSRIAKGNWQLAERHGAPYARDAAIDDMRRFVEAGITLFDCADHYVGGGAADRRVSPSPPRPCAPAARVDQARAGPRIAAASDAR